MTIYFSKLNQAFYDDDNGAHPAFSKSIYGTDPTWVRPKVPSPTWRRPSKVVEGVEQPDMDAQAPLVDDWTVQPPLIELPNPRCALPADATVIDESAYLALKSAQASGQVIDWSGAAPIAAAAPPPAAAAQWAAYQAQAQALLDKSDITVIRCVSANTPVPPPWQTYRHALRSIIGAQSGDPTQALPVCPSYPLGT